MMKRLTYISLLIFISGCSVLPYENKVSCRLDDNFGKCMSIQQAYDGSKNDEGDLSLKPGERVDTKQRKRRKSKMVSHNEKQLTSEEIYVDELYQELSLLIREPETPIIRAPKEMRTLILTYSGTNDRKTLYMPRYVYTIVEDAEFIVRQYFKTPERNATIIEPRRDK
jgi:conjugal transfer pilus assembly protein TraV